MYLKIDLMSSFDQIGLLVMEMKIKKFNRNIANREKGMQKL